MKNGKPVQPVLLPCVQMSAGGGLLQRMVGFIISYYIYILMNIILIKVQTAASATAGTSIPLAGD